MRHRMEAAAVGALTPEVRRLGHSVWLIIVPVAGFWVGSALLGLADYENGLERAVGLLVAAAGCALLPLAGLRHRRLAVVVLLGVTVVLAQHRVHQTETAAETGRVPSIDIGTTTIASVELVRAGRDPYTERIDFFGEQLAPGATGFDHVGGFKYGPVMTWAYLPGVAAAGTAGYFWTSLLALLAVALAAAYWAFRSGGPAAGAGAAALVLATAFLDGELFYAGVNDVVPMALLVAAFAARTKGGGIVSGVLLGLSFGAKLMPAGLLALPLLLSSPRRRPHVAAAAVLAAVLGYGPALLRSPRELLGNLVLFNVNRPGDRTGLLDGLSPTVGALLKVLAVASYLVLLVTVARGSRDADRRRQQAGLAAAATVAVALLYATSPVLHRNWLIWIVPFFAVAIAVKAYGEPRGRSGPAEMTAVSSTAG